MNVLVFILLTTIRALGMPNEDVKEPYSEQLRVSQRTTYITEPLRPDGHVDYLTAFNRLTSEGVTPENNLVVDLFTNFRCRELDSMQRIVNGEIKDYDSGSDQVKEWQRQYWQALGIAPPTPDSLTVISPKWDYTEPFSRFLHQVYSREQIDEMTENLLKKDYNQDLKSRYQNKEAGQSEVWSRLIFDLLQKEGEIAYEKPWTAQECPMLDKWMQAAGPVEEKIIRISKKSNFHAPQVVLEGENFSRFTVKEPHASLLYDVRSFLKIRACWHYGRQDYDAAFECAFACIRLGRTLQINAKTNAEHVCGFGMEETGVDWILNNCQNPKSLKGSAWIREKREEYESIPTIPPTWEQLPLWVTGERFIFLSTIQEIPVRQKTLISYLREFPPNFLLDFSAVIDENHAYNWNEIFRQINLHFDAMEDILALPGNQRQHQTAIREETRYKRLKSAEMQITENRDHDQMAADYLFEEFYNSYYKIRAFTSMRKRLEAKQNLLGELFMSSK